MKVNNIKWLCTLLLSLFFTSPADAQTEKAALIFVGTTINGQESKAIDVRQSDQQYWVNLNDAQDLLGLQIRQHANLFEFETPIGTIKIATDKLALFDQLQHIEIKQLSQLFNIQTHFDQPSYSLIFEVPWQRSSSRRKGTKPAVEADIFAPNSTLSLIRSETEIERSDDHTNWNTQVDLAGKLAAGSWLVGINGEKLRDPVANRYYYTQIEQEHAFRAGTHTTYLHPKTNTLHFTGAQWAYANQGIESYTDFQHDLDTDHFLKDERIRLETIIRHDGIPGGIAELRIDDKPVAHARILLDGRYGFENIQRRHNTFEQIQIYIYRNSVFAEPDSILDFTQTILSQMLNRGAFLLRAGIGRDGNPLDTETEISDNVVDDETAFVTARVGINDKLTLEAMAQQQYEADIEILAARISLNRYFSSAVDLINKNDEAAYLFSLHGQGQKWQFLIDTDEEKAGFNSQAEAQHDRRFVLAHRPQNTQSYGLKGRDKNEGKDFIRFLKPWLLWRLTPKLNLDIDPSNDGIVETEITYFANTDLEFKLFHEKGINRLTGQYDYNDRLNLQLGIESRTESNQSANENADDSRTDTLFEQLFWYPGNSTNTFLKVGAKQSDHQSSFSFSWNKLFKPGLELNLSYNQNDTGLTNADGDERVTLNLRYDLAYNGSQFQSSNNDLINLNRGAISGKLVDENGQSVSAEGVGILVNQHQLNQNAGNGEFFAGNIRPGIYQVQLDEDQLPIEYSAKQRTVNVEVARAAVTPVNFIVIAKYGVAGKILISQIKTSGVISGLTIEANDSQGKLIANSKINAFGYYRLDNLTTGTYTLNVKQHDIALAQRVVDIADEFLFDVNIEVYEFAPPAPEKLN